MKSCDLLIKDTTALIKSVCLMEHVDLAIQDGKILEVGEGIGDSYEADEQLEGRSKLFMPGLIDSHMHTGQQLLKGLVLDAKPIIWTRIMLPFESTMTRKRMALSARLAALEMIKSGTTGFVDAGSYFMEEAAEVFVESGLRGALSCSTMDEVSSVRDVGKISLPMRATSMNTPQNTPNPVRNERLLLRVSVSRISRYVSMSIFNAVDCLMGG